MCPLFRGKVNLKGCMVGGFFKITLSGRSKRNIPLPIFKNEPIGRSDEYTYKCMLQANLRFWWLRIEMQRGMVIFWPCPVLWQLNIDFLFWGFPLNEHTLLVLVVVMMMMFVKHGILFFPLVPVIIGISVISKTRTKIVVRRSMTTMIPRTTCEHKPD